MKTVFGRRVDPGMVDPYTRTIPSPDSVLYFFSLLGLREAEKIVMQIDLESILRQAYYTLISSSRSRWPITLLKDPVTMLVPQDETILAWKAKIPDEMTRDLGVMIWLCKAWIVPDMAVHSNFFEDEKMLPIMERDVKLRINMYADTIKVTINGAPVALRDFTVGNYVIHTFDKMIFPLPEGNIMDTLAAVDEFSPLVDLVTEAGLVDVLRRRFLLNELAQAAEIIHPDMPTNNGVIHVIDKVLTLPKEKVN